MKRVLMTTAVTLMLAAGAFANGHGGAAAGGDDALRGMGGPGGGGANAIVASDGTIFVTRTTVDTGTDTATTQIIAIRSNGTTAWTANLANRGGVLLSGSNLISVAENRATGGTVTTTLTALSTATGAQAWTATINGRVTDLEPFSGGTYAIVVVPVATPGGTATRSLVAISPSGATLFTVSL
jgi:outer membrane protein assembly factor BamB